MPPWLIESRLNRLRRPVLSREGPVHMVIGTVSLPFFHDDVASFEWFYPSVGLQSAGYPKGYPFRRMISSMTWQVLASSPHLITLAQELHSVCNYCLSSRTPGNGRPVTLLGAGKKLQAGHPALRFTSLLAQIVQLDPMLWWCHSEVVRLVNIFVVLL